MNTFNGRVLMVVAVSLAVVAAAISAVVVTNNRAAIARDRAVAAEAAAEQAEAEARTAQAQEAAETAKQRAAEANEKAKVSEENAQKLAQENALLEEKTAQAEQRKAEENADAEIAKSETAQAESAKAKEETERVRLQAQMTNAMARTAQARAESEAIALEKAKVALEKVAADAKLLELRKLDLEEAERTLLEWKADLEERELAIKPEKTIADLAWAGGMEDTVVDEKGNLTKVAKVEYRVEDDLTLPKPTRKLAKTERLTRTATTNDAGRVRSSVVASLQKLYVVALKDGRTIDAEFYRQTILSMYPDWKFDGKLP